VETRRVEKNTRGRRRLVVAAGERALLPCGTCWLLAKQEEELQAWQQAYLADWLACPGVWVWRVVVVVVWWWLWGLLVLEGGIAVPLPGTQEAIGNRQIGNRQIGNRQQANREIGK
jgi:hypothetical protein